MPSRSPRHAQLHTRVRISDVVPRVDCMRYPVKRTVGDPVDVRATVVADGHVQVRAELRFRLVGARRWSRVPMRTTEEEPDRFGATFRVDGPGRWEYTVAAWIDAAATWRDELRRKVEAGYQEQTDVRYAAARLWVDRVIDPAETRDALLVALEVATRYDDGRPFQTGVLQV